MRRDYLSILGMALILFSVSAGATLLVHKLAHSSIYTPGGP